MRWKKWKGPEVGQKEIRKYFAFFPTGLSDGYVVWLESYYCLEEFYMTGRDWESSHWKTVVTWNKDSDVPSEAQGIIK